MSTDASSAVTATGMVCPATTPRMGCLTWTPAGFTIVVDKIVFDGNQAIIFSHNVESGGVLDEHPPEDQIEYVLIYQIENGQLSDSWCFAPFDPTQ